MTKSNFEKLRQQPMFAHPPRAGRAAGSQGYGAVRGRDGRTARRTGRTEQFATVVSREFKAWMKAQSKKGGKIAGRAARRYEGRVHRKIRGIAMLSIWRRKPEPAAAIEQGPPEPVRRHCQQNIKVSEDCSAAFAALAKALGRQQGGALRGHGRRAARLGGAARGEIEDRVRKRRVLPWVTAYTSSVGSIRPITFRRRRWPIASIARARRSTPMCVLACCRNPRRLAICSAGTSDRLKPSSRRRMLRMEDGMGLSGLEEDAYLKGLKGGSAKKG